MSLQASKDVPMTILDYAGVEHPMQEFRGASIEVALRWSPYAHSSRGQSERPRNEEQWGLRLELFGNCYVVAGDFKAMLVRTGMYGDGLWHLYDIKKDPGETRPLEQDMPDKLQELVTLYEEHAEKTGIVPVAKNWNPWHGFRG